MGAILRAAVDVAVEALGIRLHVLDRIGGDPAGIQRVNAAFSTLIAHQKEVEQGAKHLDLKEKIKQGIEDPIGSAGAAIEGVASNIGTAGVVAVDRR